MSRLRGPTDRRFSQAPIHRRQQRQRSPPYRIRRQQRLIRRRARTRLRLPNLPLRCAPRSISRQAKPCSSNFRPGRPRKMRERKPNRSSRRGISRRYRPCRMPLHGSRKKLRRRSSPLKSSGAPSPCKMRAQRSDTSDSLGRDTGKNQAHRRRSRPYRIPGHRSRLRNLPRRHLSCKASAYVDPASSHFVKTADAASEARVSQRVARMRAQRQAQFHSRSDGGLRDTRVASIDHPRHLIFPTTISANDVAPRASEISCRGRDKPTRRANHAKVCPSSQTKIFGWRRRANQ